MNGIFLAEAFNGLTGQQLLAQAYDTETRAELSGLLRILPSGEEREADFIFSTWGMPALSQAEIAARFPRLKAIFYAAGTVRSFARPFLERGVRIFSMAAANAVPVAEVAAAQIVLANKGFFQAAWRYKSAGWETARSYYEAMPGNYGAAVGILGAGAIGRRVITLLKAYRLRVLVFDPFLSDESAKTLGVEKTDLEPLFSACGVISNHLADNPQTRHLLDYHLFSRMGPRAIFINTGRGAQVVEPDLARALAEEPDRTAILDVTVEEPLPRGHPFHTLPNVVLTPHIAGSSAGEIARMGRAALDCCKILLAGGSPEGEVTASMLDVMA